jgi:lysophospholipase L1-like esterase
MKAYSGPLCRAGLVCLLLLLGCAPQEAPPKRLPLLQLHNGDMEQGNDFPTGWGEPWVGYKRRAVSRDTTTKHAGHASLRFHLAGISGARTLEQLVHGGAGRRLTLRGWVKTQGALRVQFGLLPYDKRMQPLTLLPALGGKKTGDWTEFEQAYTLPQELGGFSVALRAEGEGTVWLDDVQLSGERVESVASDPSRILPAEHQPPEQPSPSTLGESWQENHRFLKKEAQKAKPRVVFLGDSVTAGWEVAGSDEWARFFKPLSALNLGLSGDRTSQILWRIRDGALAGLHPSVVVLGVGINNLLYDSYPPERVAAGVVACVHAIERACPGTKVLVVGIFPTQPPPTHPLRAKIKKTNALLARQVPHFLDFGGVFLNPDGTMNWRLLNDGVHPTVEGYRLYRQQLLPPLQLLLKP